MTVFNIWNLKSSIEPDSREIGNKINAAANLDEILIDLQDDITSLFNSERVTIYVADSEKDELISRVKSGDDDTIGKIRVSGESISGYSAFNQKIINIKDVYDDTELKSIDQRLNF